MPYILREARKEYQERGIPITAGELSYAITMLVRAYLNRYGKHYTYETLNSVIGAIEASKLEFYRRIVVPYEEKKRAENGDVY